MGLTKRVYENHKTVIPAENLNDIQDAIIALEKAVIGADVSTVGASASAATYALRFQNGTSAVGSVTFDKFGKPVRVEDNQGNVVTFDSSGNPTEATGTDGQFVQIEVEG